MTLKPGLFVTDDDNDVVTARDARLALAGLVSGTGVLHGGAVTGNSDTPNIKYDVAAGVWVTARGTQATDGVYIVSNDGPVTVDSGSPAPESGSRYDLVYVRQKNAASGDGFGDADSLPELGVVVGDASSTPSKPTDQLPDGALLLASGLVDSSASSGADAVITMEVSGAAASAICKTGGAQFSLSENVTRDLNSWPGADTLHTTPDITYEGAGVVKVTNPGAYRFTGTVRFAVGNGGAVLVGLAASGGTMYNEGRQTGQLDGHQVSITATGVVALSAGAEVVLRVNSYDEDATCYGDMFFLERVA